MKNGVKIAFALFFVTTSLEACTSGTNSTEQGDTTIIAASADSAIEGNSADTTVSGLQNNKDMSAGTEGPVKKNN